MTIKYTEEIFNILSKGGFISQNSTDEQKKRYYDLIEDNEQEYAEYFSGVGFCLEGENGYYYFSRKEPKVVTQDKIERLAEWIDYVDFLRTFNPSFGVGYEFSAVSILMQMNNDIEMKEKADKLFSDKHNYKEIVETLVTKMKNFSFIEVINEQESTYKVTSAFNYIDKLINMLVISEEVKDEIPE